MSAGQWFNGHEVIPFFLREVIYILEPVISCVLENFIVHFFFSPYLVMCVVHDFSGSWQFQRTLLLDATGHENWSETQRNIIIMKCKLSRIQFRCLPQPYVNEYFNKISWCLRFRNGYPIEFNWIVTMSNLLRVPRSLIIHRTSFSLKNWRVMLHRKSLWLKGGSIQSIILDSNCWII